MFNGPRFLTAKVHVRTLHYSVVIWMKGTLLITFYSSVQSVVCTERQNWNSVTCIAGL